MITREDVEENELISVEVLEEIPETCEFCGSPVVFTDTLKQIYCSNPKCKLKIAARLEAMAKNMNVDGFGDSTCLALCSQFGMTSPYQIFLLASKGADEVEGVAAFDKKMDAINNSPYRYCELWQMVSYGNIPGIDTIAFKLFSGYGTINEAYADFEKYQVPFIADKLGLKNSSTGVMAVNIYNTLMEYKAELQFGETKFRIKKVDNDRIIIAITGGVLGYANKSEFINRMNSKYDGKVSLMLKSSVTDDVRYLIHEGGTNALKPSRKLARALSMKESGHQIEIVNSDEFKAAMEEKYGG